MRDRCVKCDKELNPSRLQKMHGDAQPCALCKGDAAWVIALDVQELMNAEFGFKHVGFLGKVAPTIRNHPLFNKYVAPPVRYTCTACNTGHAVALQFVCGNCGGKVEAETDTKKTQQITIPALASMLLGRNDQSLEGLLAELGVEIVRQ